jgi:hypothetical protein
VRSQRRPGLPVVGPLFFYPWRACDVIKTTAQWLRLVWRYRKILQRVMADPVAPSYADSALSLRRADGTDGLVDVFADAIPPSYGARRPRAALRRASTAL